MSRVFLKAFTTNRSSSYFSSCAGINIQNLSLRKMLISWWNIDVRQRIVPYYNAIPSIIMWELWRIGNHSKHEEIETTYRRSILNITRNLLMLVKVRKPKRNFLNSSRVILKVLETYSPPLKVLKVKWKILQIEWV